MSSKRYLRKVMWRESRARQEVRSKKLEARNEKQNIKSKIPFASCLLLLASCLVFTGCASKQAATKPPLGYFDILPQWTKSQKVIDNLDSKLFIYATYKSWPLREAYVDEYAKRYQMDDAQKQKIRNEEKDLDERLNEFFIAVYTPDERWNDFNTSESIWKIYLEDEKKGRVAPIKIVKVDVKSPLIREFYPYLDLWSSGYIIKFPKYMIGGKEPFPGKDTNYFKLIVTGVVGSAELKWQMKDR